MISNEPPAIVNHEYTPQSSVILLSFTVAVAAEPTAFARPGESVDLTCEVFGYLRPGQDHPSWSWTETGTLIQGGGNYTITQQTGSRPSQSPDGTSAIGLVTVLTINQLDDGDTGNYSCSAIGATTPVMTALVVTSDPPTTIGSSPVATTPGQLTLLLVHVWPSYCLPCLTLASFPSSPPNYK